MKITMSQIGAVTGAGLAPETQALVLHAWLSARPLEAKRLLSAAGLDYQQTGTIMEKLGRATVKGARANEEER